MTRAARLAAIHSLCFADNPPPWSAAFFARMLVEPSIFLLERPDALLLGRVTLDEAEVLTLAVAPRARRCGHARALLAGFDAEITARGARTAFLEVAEDNHAALALYAASGWTRIGRRPRYYGPVAALIMSKTLQGGAG